MIAKGTFTVALKPETVADKPSDPALGQMSINKQIVGDLVGTSLGSMLTGGDYRTGSAAYSAIEKVTGTLNGRSGSFILQHTGVMHQGAQSLAVIVVPGSGTDALAGMTGTFAITVKDGRHYYELEYTLP